MFTGVTFYQNKYLWQIKHYRHNIYKVTKKENCCGELSWRYKDFFKLGNQTTASMAYLLLMANVLGLAIFIDGKKWNTATGRKAQKKGLPNETNSQTGFI